MTRGFVLGCANFHGFVFFGGTFLGFTTVIPILFTLEYPSPNYNWFSIMILSQCSIQKQTVVYLMLNFFNPILPGLFLGAWERGGGGSGRQAEVPTAHNSKTIYGIKMRFGMILENHKLINLV